MQIDTIYLLMDGLDMEHADSVNVDGPFLWR